MVAYVVNVFIITLSVTFYHILKRSEIMKWYQKSALILVLLIASLSIGGMTSCNASTSSTSSITSTTIKAAVTTAATTSVKKTTLQTTITPQTTTVKETTAVTSAETKPAATTKESTAATTKESTAATTAAATTPKETTAATTAAVTEPAETPPAPVLDTGTGEVYKTETGSKYHSDGCSYLSKSRIPISLADAKAEGLTPCSKCNPPQ